MSELDTDSFCAKPSCEQLIDIIPGPFVVIDRNYQILAANKAYQKQYQINSDVVVGRHCYEVSHHSNVPCSQNGEHCPLEEVFRTGQPTQVMHVHHDHDGGEEYVQIQAAPIHSDSGEVLYMGEFMQTVHKHGDENAMLIGRSLPLLRMTSLLQRVAPTRTSVLLLGESGVGKERVAEYLHHFSDRSKKPFRVVDCGTLGENLIESELFGHEKAAFTGAVSRKIGLIESADKGTLLIDEIGELPLLLQTKLLRVLESGTIRRLGGTNYLKVDVRIIAATNRNLQEMVAQGQFRQDLYYRLSAFPIRVPPLRERKDDITMLAEHFIARIDGGERHLPISSQVIEKLLSYDYPGNIRELRNIIERALILAIDDTLRPEHIVIEARDSEGDDIGQQLASTDTVGGLYRRKQLTMDTISEALGRFDGHRLKAAQYLGVSERTLYRHIQKLNVS
jgi:transcriptional regulator with PAS, ATPase and Fis domain